MKSSQSKNIIPANSNHSPFFQKERSNNFFGKSNKPFFNPSPIQAKLTVNQPNDPYEKEADAMADKATQVFTNSSFTNSENNSTCFFNKPYQSVQRECAACEKEGELQKKTETPSTQPASAFVASNLNSSKGSGSALPHNTRQHMESFFGADFSNVRLHNDSSAVQMSKELNAQAFTNGSDIYFNSGKYDTNSKSGQHLLAHELTHTIQQSGDANLNLLQRTIGDGHDFTSPRFAGDLVLEAVYDNERLLKAGDNGDPVRKLQQALVDSGFSLPRFGVDGIFGPETTAAVRQFQLTSGLIGGNIDGIVGPTTMGWLDQRFSAGPTPLGTSPGATTGCPVIKTLNVDMVSLNGSTRNPFIDLEVANTVFSQCCVRFVPAGGGSEDAARTAQLLGGDTDLNNSPPSCAAPTAEEISLFNGATADFGLGSSIRVFYVNTINSGAGGFSRPPFCASGAASGLRGMAVMQNATPDRGLAHEFGHILLNSGVHGGANDLMEPSAAGAQLSPAQCATIFAAVP